jgi:transcriptional regulator with XRE-family HTH domain
MRIINKRIAEYMFRRRIELNLTQQDLATNIFGINRNAQFISNLERGKCQFPPKHLKKLAIYLDVSIDHLARLMAEDYEESILHENGEL